MRTNCAAAAKIFPDTKHRFAQLSLLPSVARLQLWLNKKKGQKSPDAFEERRGLVCLHQVATAPGPDGCGQHSNYTRCILSVLDSVPAATVAASVSQRWTPQPAPAASGQLLPGRLWAACYRPRASPHVPYIGQLFCRAMKHGWKFNPRESKPAQTLTVLNWTVVSPQRHQSAAVYAKHSRCFLRNTRSRYGGVGHVAREDEARFEAKASEQSHADIGGRRIVVGAGRRRIGNNW